MPTCSSGPAGRVTPVYSEDITTSGSDESKPRLRRSKRKIVTRKNSKATKPVSNGDANGYLKVPNSPGRREPSRSPSPLGTIPIHTQFRSFIHRHEVPRKTLHVSIGFLALSFYSNGYQVSQIHPALLTTLIPIATADVLRHNIPALNQLYVKVWGALMRESEVDGYNGVIWYLAGTWAVLRFFPKDIGVMGVLLLSWCDTAASTVGRAWGRYTWRVRRGKSFAGSAAAFAVGVATAWTFWGWAAPTFGAPNGYDAPPHEFAFRGALALPQAVCGLLGWKQEDTVITGSLAIGALSVVSGLIASASEAVDIFNWDDNFTIPVICGVGLWGFLKTFGSS